MRSVSGGGTLIGGVHAECARTRIASRAWHAHRVHAQVAEPSEAGDDEEGGSNGGVLRLLYAGASSFYSTVVAATNAANGGGDGYATSGGGGGGGGGMRSQTGEGLRRPSHPPLPPPIIP